MSTYKPQVGDKVRYTEYDPDGTKWITEGVVHEITESGYAYTVGSYMLNDPAKPRATELLEPAKTPHGTVYRQAGSTQVLVYAPSGEDDTNPWLYAVEPAWLTEAEAEQILNSKREVWVRV